MGPVSPRPVPTVRRRPHRRRWVLLAGVAVVAACSVADDPPPEETAPAEQAPIASSTPDPARDALDAEVERLGATVATAREALAETLDASTPARARQAATDALALLVAGADDGDDPRPLFPAESLGRDEVSDAPDQLTNTLTAARDVGGAHGNAVVDLLRDPVAGDLGAWQRDAAGVLLSIEATTQEAADLDGLEMAIAELPGLGTQAVAWVQLAAAATSLDQARAFAERGLAGLDTIVVGVDLLTRDAEGDAGDDDAAAGVPGAFA